MRFAGAIDLIASLPHGMVTHGLVTYTLPEFDMGHTILTPTWPIKHYTTCNYEYVAANPKEKDQRIKKMQDFLGSCVAAWHEADFQNAAAML